MINKTVTVSGIEDATNKFVARWSPDHECKRIRVAAVNTEQGDCFYIWEDEGTTKGITIGDKYRYSVQPIGKEPESEFDALVEVIGDQEQKITALASKFAKRTNQAKLLGYSLLANMGGLLYLLLK